MLALHQLAQLSIFSQADIINITPLIDGLSHQLHKVSYKSNSDNNDVIQHCVLRFIKANLQQTAQEYSIMQKAYALGIAPEPFAFIDITEQVNQICTLIVMDYIDADLAINRPLNNNYITQLTHCLNTLHNTDIKNSKITLSPNAVVLLNEYWDQFIPKTLINIERFSAIKHSLETIEFKNTCLIHGDLNLSNILVTANKMTWIDWEYASIGDAYFDYATLCVESVDDIEEKLITSLESNKLTNVIIDRERLRVFKLYYAATCWLWSPALPTNAYDEHRGRYESIVDQLLINS